MATNRPIQTYLKYPLAKEYRGSVQKRNEQLLGFGESIADIIQNNRSQKLGERQQGLAENVASSEAWYRGEDVRLRGAAEDRAGKEFTAKMNQEEAMQTALLKHQRDEARAERQLVRDQMAQQVLLQDDAQAFEKLMVTIKRDAEKDLIDAEQAKDEALMHVQEGIDKAMAEHNKELEAELTKLQGRIQTSQIDAQGNWDIKITRVRGEEERATQEEGSQQEMGLSSQGFQEDLALLWEKYRLEGAFQEAALAADAEQADADRALNEKLAGMDDATKRYIAELNTDTDKIIAGMRTGDTEDAEKDAAELMFGLLNATSVLTGLGFNPDDPTMWDPSLLPFEDETTMQKFRETFQDILTLKLGGDPDTAALVLQAFNSYMDRYAGQNVPEGGGSRTPRTVREPEPESKFPEFMKGVADEWVAAGGGVSESVRQAAANPIESTPEIGYIAPEASGPTDMDIEEQGIYNALKALQSKIPGTTTRGGIGRPNPDYERIGELLAILASPGTIEFSEMRDMQAEMQELYDKYNRGIE